MDNSQIYLVIQMLPNTLSNFELMCGHPIYLTDKIEVARYLKMPNARVYLFPQNVEITEAKVELL